MPTEFRAQCFPPPPPSQKKGGKPYRRLHPQTIPFCKGHTDCEESENKKRREEKVSSHSATLSLKQKDSDDMAAEEASHSLTF